MKPTKAIKALQSMHEYLTDKVAIATIEQREPNGYDLRNKAALEDAIGIYGKLLDYIARQRAEGFGARLDDAQWEAWCVEVLGDVLNRPTNKDRAHLARVKELPCSVCDAPPPSEAHHAKQGSQYTKSELGKADKNFEGCKWKR